MGSHGTAVAGKIAYRSNAPVAMTPANGATFLDAYTAEILLGTVTFTVTGSSGSVVIQMIPRGGTTSGVALWNEDWIGTAKTPGTGTFGANPPGDLGPIPEPASGVLVGLTAIGLTARRRNRERTF